MNGFQVDNYLKKNIEKIKDFELLHTNMITILLQEKCFKSIVQQIFFTIIHYYI